MSNINKNLKEFICKHTVDKLLQIYDNNFLPKIKLKLSHNKVKNSNQDFN